MLQLVASDGSSCVRESGADYEPNGRNRRASLTDARLLEADFGRATRPEQAHSLQRALTHLSAFQARVELTLGTGLELLRTRFDIRELGHSNLQALCTGRLGFSASHGRELRTLAKRLPALPHLHDLFLTGRLPRARLREVLGVATPADEAGWAQLATQLTSRQLKQRIRQVQSGSARTRGGACASMFEEDDTKQRIAWLATPAERSAWKYGLAAVRQILNKHASLAEVADMLAAETLSDLEAPTEAGLERQTEREANTPDAAHGKGALTPRQRKRKLPALRKALRKLKSALARAEASSSRAFPQLAEPSACETAGELLDQLTTLTQHLSALDFERSRLLAWMHGRSLYRELGHSRFHDWLTRVQDMSPREAHGLIGLQTKLSLLPSIENAWREAELSTHQARQLARVACAATEDDWLLYARTVTPKLLDAAVERLLLEADSLSALAAQAKLRPPWNVPHRQHLLDWQEHFGLRCRKALREARGACASEVAAFAVALREPRSGCRDHRTIGFSVASPIAERWRLALAAVRARAGMVLTDAEVVRFMIEHVVAVHVTEDVLAHARRHRAIERDGWTCQMPHCRSMGPFHEHHRQFRSRGGGDELENLVTLCEGCHAMLHAGHVTITGRAPDELIFLLGTRRERYAGEVHAPAESRTGQRGARPSTMRSMPPKSLVLRTPVNPSESRMSAVSSAC